MPPSRSMRTDDEMSVQEPETTHVSVAHPSASEKIPSDVLVASVEPEDSVPTTPPRRFLLKRPPNSLNRVDPRNVPEVTKMIILHVRFIIMIWRRCQKI